MRVCNAPDCEELALGAEMAATLANIYGCDVGGLCADHANKRFRAAARRLDAPGPASDLEHQAAGDPSDAPGPKPEPDTVRLPMIDDGTDLLLWLQRKRILNLDDRNRSICDATADLGCLNRAEIARRVGVSRSTVSRRVQQLRDMAVLVQPLTDVGRWHLLAANLRGEFDTPEEAELASHHQRTARAIRRRKRFLQTRCPSCGRYVKQPATGHPRKYCKGKRGDACRKRYNRRLARTA